MKKDAATTATAGEVPAPVMMIGAPKDHQLFLPAQPVRDVNLYIPLHVVYSDAPEKGDPTPQGRAAPGTPTGSAHMGSKIGSSEMRSDSVAFQNSESVRNIRIYPVIGNTSSFSKKLTLQDNH